jgi:PAS domain S-box-containing protein
LRLLEETGLKKLRVINRPIPEFRQDFCFAVRKGDGKTLALLNEGLALLMADGTFRQLHAKWFASLEIPSSRRIIVGGDANFPPYDYLDEDGKPAGLVVDLVTAVADAAGIEIDIRLGAWPEVRTDLETSRIDMILGMIYSPERDLKYDFSPPHTVCEYVVACLQHDKASISALEELAGKKVAVVQDDIMHEKIKERKISAEVTAVDNYEEGFACLQKGQADYLLIPRLLALYLIKKQNISGIELSKQSLYSTEYCFAFANGNKALLAKFAEGLKAVEDSGEYRKIRDKWLGIYGVRDKDFQEFIGYLVWVTIPLLLILLLAFVWSWTLRRQVAYKTAQLQQSEEQFRSLVENAPTGIYVQIEDKIAYINEEACRLFGATQPARLFNKVILDFLPESAHGRYKQLISSSVNDEKMHRSLELMLLRLDGSYVPVELAFAHIKYRGNDAVLVFANDISIRKASEAEIDRLTAAVEQVGEIILITDTDAKIQYANPALETITGFSRSEVLGQKTSLFKSGQHDQAFYKDLWDTITSGRTWNGRMTNKCRDGSLIIEEATISPIFDHERIVSFVAVKHDITEQLRLNEQLQQAQKMEAVGQLAGGVAHDYNNMLGVILGYTELAIDVIDDEASTLHDYLSEVHRAASRSAEITGQLLAFARKQTIAPKVLDLNDTLSGMLKMLRRLIGENITLDWMPGSGTMAVKMDITQLNQILANLCVNARDAIEGSGRILIETEMVRFDKLYCTEHPGYLPGDFIQLSVSDDGRGIDEAVKDKIFEPFFTTKTVGRGTGLGLATVFGVVKQNSGFINVYSELNQGTTFKIYLPKHAGDSIEVREEPGSSRSFGNGETIIIVEDDPAILRMASKILTRAGYNTIASGTPSEALLLVENLHRKIDLLLTDVVMPGMNGRELYEKLQTIDADLKCLYMSGYTANVIAQQGVLKQGINFIAKPFSNLSLLKAVSEVLNQKERPDES